jgi:hypothetical protein
MKLFNFRRHIKALLDDGVSIAKIREMYPERPLSTINKIIREIKGPIEIAYGEKPDVPQSLVDEYNNGESANVLARKYGLTTHIVIEHLRERGIAIRRGFKQPIKIDNQKAIELYNEGLTLADIGKNFGVSDKVISRVLKANGIKVMRRLKK